MTNNNHKSTGLGTALFNAIKNPFTKFTKEYKFMSNNNQTTTVVKKLSGNTVSYQTKRGQEKMFNNICKILGITTVGIIVGLSSASAQAGETFSVREGKALNTNNNFRRIDGQPRMSIFRRNDSDADQIFDRLPGSRGGILLKHRSTGKCLNAYRTSNGSEMNVWPCNPADLDQNWNVIPVGDGYNLIQRVGTNRCVDTPTRNDSGKVHLWDCDRNNGNQRWFSSAGSVTGAEPFFRWAIGQRNIARLDNKPQYDGQCVSLIARYIAEVFLPANQKTQSMTLGNGKDTASVVSRTFSQYFQPLTNQGLPKRGAVISFPSMSAPWGHVAIVMASQQLPNGQRQVKIMDSNGRQGKVVAEQTWWINIPNGSAQGYGSGIVWTNPK